MVEALSPLDRILQGNCVDVLGTLPERCVDLVFADPPYNLQLRNELWRPNMTKVDAVDDAWDQFDSFEAYDQFTRAWLSACRRVLKDTGTIWVIGTYHNIFRVGAILQNLGYWILNDVVWVKTNPMPNFHGVRFTNAHETLIWAQKDRGAKYTFNHHVMKALNDDLQMRSDWVFPTCVGKERIRANGAKAHATQKPEALLYRVILSSTNPGAVILDPFFGSGTTGVVARLLGRHWLGIEQDPDYIRIANKRLEEVQALPDDVLRFSTPRQQPRVPFGALIESGLLRPGQVLSFGPQDGTLATVLADGHIRCGDTTGSIHQIARQLTGAPCNGWEAWYYVDAQTGQRLRIDQLRQRLRVNIHKGV